MNFRDMDRLWVIEDIYSHLNKVCTQNKTKIPPKTNELYLELEKIIIHFDKFLNPEVVIDIKRNLWYLWRKDSNLVNNSKKRGFLACFVLAVEKSIPLSLEGVTTLFLGLDDATQDYFEIAEHASISYFREGMVFQYGSAKTMQIFSQQVSKSDFKELCRKALDRAKRQEIKPIDRWNYICKWVDDFAGKILSESGRPELEISSPPNNNFGSRQKKLHPFDALDRASESRS